MRKPNTPAVLGPEGTKFWKKCNAEFFFERTHDLERLLIACKCLDDLEAAEIIVKNDGHFIENRYGNITEHPAIKTIKDMRRLFIQIIRELGLDLEKIEKPRPPKMY